MPASQLEERPVVHAQPDPAVQLREPHAAHRAQAEAVFSTVFRAEAQRSKSAVITAQTRPAAKIAESRDKAPAETANGMAIPAVKIVLRIQHCFSLAYAHYAVSAVSVAVMTARFRIA